MPKLGLKLWSLNTDDYYGEAVRLYQASVYDYIELYVVPGTSGTLPKWKQLRIPFIIHAPHFAHGFNLAKMEKKQRNREIYSEVKQFADELNAPYIIFHGGIDGDIWETATQLAALEEPRALLENKPFKALPNRMHGNFCRGYNAEEVGYVMRQANCGFCFDFGHAVCAANSQKKDIFAYFQTFLSLNPTIFHLTDIEDIQSEYDSHPHLGEGQLNLAKVIPLIGREKLVTLETNKNSKTVLDDFTRDVQVFKRLYNAK